jgi:hypothetical protein
MARKKKQIILEGDIETTDQKLPMGGLGDLVKSVTEVLGITQCSECIERQKNFNKAFPFIRVSRDLTFDELKLMERINSSYTIQNDDVNSFFKMYNEVFTSNVKRCNCPELIAKMIQRINTFIN